MQKKLALMTAAALSVTALVGSQHAATASPTRSGADLRAPKFDKDEYLIAIKAPAACKVKATCAVEVSVTSKGTFHINPEYPIKFKVSEPVPDGLTYSKNLLTKADGKFGEKQGTLSVPFVAAKAGKPKVGGTLAISVCSEAKCLIEKLDLEVDVDVK